MNGLSPVIPTLRYRRAPIGVVRKANEADYEGQDTAGFRRTPESRAEKTTPTSAIIGAVVGLLLLITLVLGFLVYYLYRVRQRREREFGPARRTGDEKLDDSQSIAPANLPAAHLTPFLVASFTNSQMRRSIMFASIPSFPGSYEGSDLGRNGSIRSNYSDSHANTDYQHAAPPTSAAHNDIPAPLTVPSFSPMKHHELPHLIIPPPPPLPIVAYAKPMVQTHQHPLELSLHKKLPILPSGDAIDTHHGHRPNDADDDSNSGD